MLLSLVIMTFSQLALELGLELRVPSEREVGFVEASERATAARGAVLVGSSSRLVAKLRPTVAGCLVQVQDDVDSLIQSCEVAGYGLAFIPPWLSVASALDQARTRLLHSRRMAVLGLGSLMDLMLSRLSDQRAFVEFLGHLLGLPLALVSPWGEVLAWSGPVPSRHPTHTGRFAGGVVLEAGEWRLVAYAVESRLDDCMGTLELAARLLRLRSQERALERAKEESLGAAFLDELLLGEAEIARAATFGLEEGLPVMVALLEAPAPSGRHRLAEARRREALEALKRAAGAFLERRGVPYLLSGRGSRAVALWQVHQAQKEALALLTSAPAGVRLGYSAVHRTLENAQAAYREALIALKAAQAGQALGFEQLDPVAWVLLQQSPEDLRALVERFLPLEAKLLRTLEVYIQSGDVNHSAQTLHCHTNTLKYRLAQIEAKVGLSLKSPQSLAQLHLAIRAKNLLDDRAFAKEIP